MVVSGRSSDGRTPGSGLGGRWFKSSRPDQLKSGMIAAFLCERCVMKIGIFICNRYRSCAGGKCFKAVKNREEAFKIYDEDEELEVVGYSSCGGCTGGNIEHATEEMMKNGAEAIHLAIGFVVGYPSCPYITQFKRFIEEKYDVKVVIGIHTIPQKYYIIHEKIGSWNSLQWQELIKPTLTNESVRESYN